MEHPTVERHRRRSKGKERAIQPNLPRAIPRPQDVPLPSSPEAGPSKLSAQQEWEYVPIAQNEISSVPPVWSRDGRYVPSLYLMKHR
jgi:NET1-associated nuclear protein 1 (U3 small nucleolar RNA-associated protein 17)